MLGYVFLVSSLALPYLCLATHLRAMSSSIQSPSFSSPPNFQPIFEKALNEYKKKTGKDLTSHPLAAEIKDCNSPEAILTVLEGKAKKLNESRSSDERLSKWLDPTVNVLNALSATLGQGAGMVSYSLGYSCWLSYMTLP